MKVVYIFQDPEELHHRKRAFDNLERKVNLCLEKYKGTGVAYNETIFLNRRNEPMTLLSAQVTYG